MGKFKFRQSILMKVWCDADFTVDADTEEEALKKASSLAHRHIDVSESCDEPDIDFIGGTYQFDTAEYVSSTPDQPSMKLSKIKDDGTVESTSYY